MTVDLENGYKYVFVRKEGRTGVTVYDKDGKRTTPMLEVVELTDPDLGKALRFTYDNGVAIDEVRTTAAIVKIHVE